MSIFNPTNSEHLLKPFGPTVGYFKMPDELLDVLNNSIEKKLHDFSDHLVGKVSQELKFDSELEDLSLSMLKNFVKKYVNFTIIQNTLGRNNLDINKEFNVKVVDGWFVRQFAGEYNPLHVHPNSQMSCVGYLALPDNIEKEWEEDYKDHHPCNGHIEFSSGDPVSLFTLSSFRVKPQIGDFYIFPGHLKHCVYPFMTEGERRSFSINMNVI